MIDGAQRAEFGFSLVEMLVTVAVLGLVASLALPGMSDARPDAPRIALQAVSDALRYARAQAALTGDIHGVDVNDNVLRVFRLSTLTTPATAEYTVPDPLTRQPYRLVFGSGALRDIRLGSLTWGTAGNCTAQTSVGFDAQGLSRCINPLDQRADVTIPLSYRGTEFVVTVESLTGRVHYRQ